MRVNSKNERVKRKYLIHIRETRQLDEKSLESVAAALERFEIQTNRRDFREHRPEQAVAFKRHLAEQRNKRTKARLSKSTIVSTLNSLRHFFFWLSGQRGYRSRLNRDDADYFKPSLKDVATAKASASKRPPTLDDIKAVISAMPTETALELRDRALLTITIVTGARDDATASLRLKHLDLEQRVLRQQANQVRTKFAKTFDSWFFPVGSDFEEILSDWKHYLTEVLGFGPEDPLFPSTRMGLGPNGEFVAVGLNREGWSTTEPIRKVFRSAFKRAELPYANPHLFRDTLMQLGYRLCKTPEELVAWSQNLGHEKVMTSITSYGQLSPERQRDIVLTLGQAPDEDERALALGRELLKTMKRVG